MGHVSTRTSDRITMNERLSGLSRALVHARARVSSFRCRSLSLYLPPCSRSRYLCAAFFSLCHRNSFSADLDGQASYANCRFFWPENQLWPAVQQVSCWWVTANFYLSVRAREVEEERRRGRGGRVGERG